MSNLLYPKFKENLLSGNINLPSNTIKAQPIDLADYTYNAAHDALDDVPSAARVGTAGTLANKSVTDGVFDADDVTLSGVSGDQFEAVLLYKDTGTESTSLLIALLDTATGLPLTPSGGGVIVSWDNGANKIFKL